MFGRLFGKSREPKVEPHPLRPHHLKAIMELTTETPEQIARKHRESSERAPSTEIDPAVLSTPEAEKLNGPLWRAVYRTDTIGKNGEHADAFEAGVTDTLRRFTELPPEYPVRLGMNLLDGICNSRAFSHHCRNTDETANSDDAKTLKIFEFTAQHLGRSIM